MTDHQRPLTETQALAWLHSQPDGTIATTVSDLARSWGWNRSTTSRRVKVWVASGQLVRSPGPDGRSIFTARTSATDLLARSLTPGTLRSVSEEATMFAFAAAGADRHRLIRIAMAWQKLAPAQPQVPHCRTEQVT